MRLSILRAGFLTTVQDLGRTGFRASGVSVGGALDPLGLRVANLLAGNDESAAGLEITLGNFRARFDDERIVAWCGAAFQVRIGQEKIAPGQLALVRANEELIVDPADSGMRGWLAISGGIDVPQVLGSRATDLRAQFGGLEGRVLRDGDSLPLADLSPRSRSIAKTLRNGRVASWSAPVDWSSAAKRNPILRIVRGKDVDLFEERAFEVLTSERFIVRSDSDRMGVRLDGPELSRKEKVDLVSEAVAPGTIQVPPSGHPVLLLGDCQTIGGYPKIAHVITVDLPIAAQLRPDDRVRFQEFSLSDAHQLLLEREKDFARFKLGLELQSR
jgi:antagonist of KipI